MSGDRQLISELNSGAAGIACALAATSSAARAAQRQRAYEIQCHRRDAAIRAAEATHGQRDALAHKLALLRKLNSLRQNKGRLEAALEP